MTGQEFYNLIMSRLGKRSSTELRNIVLQETAEAVKSLSRASWAPWFLFTDSDVGTTSGVSRIDTGLEILNLEDEYPFLRWIPATEYGVSPEEWRLLVRKEAFRLQSADPLDAEPEFWARAPGLVSFKVDLYPTPDVDGYLRIQAYTEHSAPPDSPDPSTNVWLIHAARWLVAEVCAVVAAQHLQNTNLSQGFQLEEQRERESHWRKSHALRNAQQEYVKGED